MPKTINITNVDIKQFNVSCVNNKINITLTYTLLDELGKEYDFKTGTIKDEELTQPQKNHINNIISAIGKLLKQREGI